MSSNFLLESDPDDNSPEKDIAPDSHPQNPERPLAPNKAQKPAQGSDWMRDRYGFFWGEEKPPTSTSSEPKGKKDTDTLTRKSNG